MPDSVANPETLFSACPHDCPSTCALEVERLDDRTIGRVRGSHANTFTDGAICAKVARYHERVHHPDRLTKCYQRIGAKGDGDFREISWDAALDETAEALTKAEAKYGAETVWPYFYAGPWGWYSAIRSIGCGTQKSTAGSIPRSVPRSPGTALSPERVLFTGSTPVKCDCRTSS